MSQHPQKIGKYEIRQELGKGAMGVVYLAYDTVLERDVALKVMASSITSDPELKDRFEREAKAVARLHHPNIVTVYDLGYDDQGAPFIAMEYLRGTEKDLEHLMRKASLPLEKKLAIVEQICRGLAHAHQQGIVHRDIKPANIFVTESGEIKIMDFGVAHWRDQSHTQTGQVLGTADYMSPEQIQGKRVDGRTDIFSVGVILYRLLTSKKPFAGDNIQAVFFKVLHQDPPALLLPDGHEIPELQEIVDRALAKDSEERFQTSEEMAEALKGFLRLYEGALAEETVFDTMFDPSAPVDHESSPSGRIRRGTLRPGTGRFGTTSPGRSGTYRTTAATGAVGRTAAGRTAIDTMRPTTVVAPTRVVRPGVAAGTRHRRSSAPLVVVLVLAVAAIAGGAYVYVNELGPFAAQATDSSPPITAVADLESRFQTAETYLSQGELDRAFGVVQAILASQPDNQRAKELEARINAAYKESQSAPQPPSPPVAPSGTSKDDRARRLATDAAMALAGNQLDQAEALIAEGQRLEPSLSDWSTLKTRIQERRRQLRDQESARQEAAAVAALVERGLAFLDAQQYEEAIDAFNQALQQDPANQAAKTGIVNAKSLRQAAELARQPPQPAGGGTTRALTASKTEFIAPAGTTDAPRGFQTGDVKVNRATTAPDFPAQLDIELNPVNALPGQPYVLRVRIFNEGNRAIFVKSLELVSKYSGQPPMGKGVEIPARTQRINAKATGVLHEVQGVWNEEMSQGAIEVTVNLMGDGGMLKKSIQW